MDNACWVVEISHKNTSDISLCANAKSVAEVLFRRVLRNKQYNFPEDAHTAIKREIFETYSYIGNSTKIGDTVYGRFKDIRWKAQYLPIADYSDDIFTNYDLKKIQERV